jgi:hypothetical protein
LNAFDYKRRRTPLFPFEAWCNDGEPHIVRGNHV